jgi:hypothetical protein
MLILASIRQSRSVATRTKAARLDGSLAVEQAHEKSQGGEGLGREPASKASRLNILGSV